MKHEFLRTGKSRKGATIVLAHGAGAPMESDWMNELAEVLAARKHRVVRFEFPYMAQRRTTGKKKPPDSQPRLLETWRSVIAQLGRPESLVIGGKSMGGRMASLVADELGVRALVCLGYPFHPPGRPERLRTENLADLATKALIVQGERDTFGTREEVDDYDLSTSIEVAWMPDGDHSFKPRVKSGFTLRDNLEACGEAVDQFLAGL